MARRCGRPANTRVKLFFRQRGRCYYCGERMIAGPGPDDGRQPPKLLTLDHIIPKSQGGANVDNLVAACAQCNNERGDKDARLFMLEKQGALA